VTALAYLACTLIWGTTFFAIRQCIGPDGYPTMLSAALRFVIAAVILGAVVLLGWARPGPRGWRAWGWLAACAALNVVGYASVYAAEEKIVGGLAAVLYGCMPFVTALVAAVTRTERARPAALAGAAVSLVGVTVIFWDRMTAAPDQVIGVVLMLVSIVCSASYSVIFKREARDQHPLATTAGFLGLTAVGMTLVVLLFERQPMPWPPPVGPTVALLYLTIFGSVIAFGTYFFLLKRMSLMGVATLTLTEPLVALLVDAAWEDQPLTARAYLGACITLAGVGVNLAIEARQRRLPAQA
jgi:drug/metabolite transporter (DMT)-like permease